MISVNKGLSETSLDFSPSTNILWFTETSKLKFILCETRSRFEREYFYNAYSIIHYIVIFIAPVLSVTCQTCKRIRASFPMLKSTFFFLLKVGFYALLILFVLSSTGYLNQMRTKMTVQKMFKEQLTFHFDS